MTWHAVIPESKPESNIFSSRISYKKYFIFTFHCDYIFIFRYKGISKYVSICSTNKTCYNGNFFGIFDENTITYYQCNIINASTCWIVLSLVYMSIQNMYVYIQYVYIKCIYEPTKCTQPHPSIFLPINYN